MAITSEIPISPLVFLLIYTPILCSGHRKILHQPFFPVETLPPAAQPPLPPPRQQPKYPFSSTQTPFFPLSVSPPPPHPPPPPTVAVTFPANISSLPLPNRSSKPISRKFLAVAVSLSLLSAALVASLILLHLRRRKSAEIKTESRSLFPSKTPSSDKPVPVRSPASTSNLSGEYLYIGTMRGIEENFHPKNGLFSSIATSSAGEYQRLSSPELHPLPPLPRHQPFSSEFYELEEDEEFEQFFSPNLSPNNMFIKNNNSGSSPPKVIPSASFGGKTSNLGNFLFRSSISSSPIDSIPSNSSLIAKNLSSRSLNSNSLDLFKTDFGAQPIFQNNNLSQTHDSTYGNHEFSAKMEPPSVSGQDNPFQARLPPPPPPLPPPRFWEFFEVGKGGHVAADDLERSEEGSSSRPRLKPLHWDKVRASSDRAMAWDHIKSSSFRLNEEMIETLFMINGHSSSSRENTPRKQNRILDPKKSQNIAILLRALNVTVDEVCEALIEGTTDTLGTELLESLLKMAPGKEEERKLKECKDDSPAKLGPAEKFLKAVLDIPFAFQRVDAMLYIANFDSEVEYLTRSFETIKAACEELKNSGMFRKLLDAVLQTGNRMNLGTNRGDAQAFKLDTLLKLVDIKGIDSKTTVLHFVVQEISRVEGSNLTTNPTSTPVQGDIESLKFGLRVVSSLSRELDNVKKSADMDAVVLGNEVAKLSRGISKINEVLKLNEEYIKLKNGERFSESMKGFLDRAEREIVKVRGLESESLCLVKEIAKYFHGDSDKEEAHRFRIFKVVRDFIYILDGVCKEVEKVNEWSFVGLAPPFLLNPNDARKTSFQNYSSDKTQILRAETI